MTEAPDEVLRQVERFTRFALLTLRRDATELTRKWLDELRARLPEHPQRIFPDETLLNHIPDLLRSLFGGISDGSTAPDDATIHELSLLVALRRSQGYGLDEVLSEFEILRELVLEHLREAADSFPHSIPPGDALEVAASIERAIGRIVTVTSHVYYDHASASRRRRAELLSAFGRTVTHELRNRLNAALLTLRLYRETAKDGGDDGPALLETLEHALQRIERVVGDVFTVAVAQQHHAQVEGAMQPLDELLAESVEDLREFAFSRGVKIRVAPEVPPIPVDATRVQLILMNLCTNAVKYSDRRKRERWIEIRVRRGERAREWRLDVEDNGIGIPEGLQEHVFNESLRSPESSGEDGEGIGLSLAREAALQLNGRLWFSSVEGKGSTFSFTIEEPSERLRV